jgi:hypothetical protein
VGRNPRFVRIRQVSALPAEHFINMEMKEGAIRQPRRSLQIKFTRPIAGDDELSPTLTPSGRWTASAACSNRKPLPAATRRNQTACWRLILSWSAIPGSLESRKWLK